MRRLCLRLLGAILVAPLLCIGATPANLQDDPNSDIYGEWRVTRDTSPVGTIGARNQRQIQAIIGKLATIGPEQFSFNGSHCKSPKYSRSSDDTATYFYREWRVNSEEMPFGNRVTIIEVDCARHALYPVDKNRLIIADDGNFFEAVRVGAELSPKSPPTQADEAPSKVNADIFGTWLIDGADWKGSGNDSEATKKRKAGIYMGMPVYISATHFFYNENQCKNPSYKRSRQEKVAYFHGDWRAAKGRLLFLPKILTVVETDCGTIYPINKKLIIIEDPRGMFFTAVPI